MYKTLDRNELFEGSAVPEWATAAAYFGELWYFEESLEQLYGGRFQQVGGNIICKYNGETTKGFEKAVLFTPLMEQDDPLPPAPESVRYYTVPSKTQYLDILTNEFGEVEIRSILPDFASYNYLTPDAALQLAHDLNRMTNEIKRKEKQRLDDC